MKSIYPFNTFASIPDKIRDIARQDLTKALVHSNQKLVKQLSIKPLLLKSKQQLSDIARATEGSIYTDFQFSPDSYYETLTSMISFLSDKSLTRDLLIFRLLINTPDVTDLYTIPELGELLVTEMLLCNADQSLRRICIQNITHQISSRVTAMRKAYDAFEPYEHQNMTYYIPPEMKREMHTMKDVRATNIVNDLQSAYYNNPRHPTRADSMYDHMSMLSSDDESVSEESHSDSLRDADNVATLHVFAPDNDSEKSDDDLSDYSEIPEDMISGTTCEMCPALYSHSYCTPVQDKDGNYRFKYFCSSPCMESWVIQ